MKWISRLRSRNQLPDLLKTYPVYRAPYPQRAMVLSVYQALENLRYLLDHKESRLKILDQFLMHWGINVLGSLRQEKPETLVSALHKWSGTVWPQAHDERIANNKRWQASCREGEEIIYSLIMDTAILLGELIIVHRPSYVWAVDLNEENINFGRVSGKRCVVQAKNLAEPDIPIIVDVEAIVVDRFLYPNDFSQRHENLWWQAVKDAISGTYEATDLFDGIA
jgi:hypothetical protein